MRNASKHRDMLHLGSSEFNNSQYSCISFLLLNFYISIYQSVYKTVRYTFCCISTNNKLPQYMMSMYRINNSLVITCTVVKWKIYVYSFTNANVYRIYGGN